MAAFEGFYTQEEREKLNKQAVKKLTSIFKDLDKNKFSVIKSLVESVAFMSVQLKELEGVIKRDGAIEEYRNGRFQSGLKKSVAVEVYNSLIKNYSTCLKQLIDVLKSDFDETSENIGDKFDEFLAMGRNQY